MLGSDILEVAIGLVFVYLLMSLLATAGREILEGWMKTRGRFLEQGLMELFEHETYKTDDGRNFLARFYTHPLIFSLFRGDYLPPEQRTRAAVKDRKAQPAAPAETADAGRLPSYIPSTHFANAILGVAESYLRPGTGGAPLSFDRLTAAAWAVPNPPVRRVLLQALASAKGDLDQARLFLENWYDGAMDRVAGWYRRHTQVIVFFAGLAVCVALNVNTILIGHALHENTGLRTAVGEAAKQWVASHPPPPPCDPATLPKGAVCPPATTASLSDQFQEPQSLLNSLSLPIGWGKPVRDLMWARLGNDLPDQIVGWAEIALGWLMTALAITLGAPFWFDVLNTIMVVRSTVKPTEKSPDEPSKDGRGVAADTASAATQATPAPVGAPPPPYPAADSAGQAEIAALDPASRPREEDAPDPPAAAAPALAAVP